MREDFGGECGGAWSLNRGVGCWTRRGFGGVDERCGEVGLDVEFDFVSAARRGGQEGEAGEMERVRGEVCAEKRE